MNYKFGKSDFSNMFFKIHGLKDPFDDVRIRNLRILMKLNPHNAFKKRRAVKYFIYLYDKGSPLVRQIPDINRRREIAAEMAGFKLDKEEKVLEQYYNLSHQLFRDVVAAILLAQNDRVIAMISTLEIYWEQLIRQIIAEVEDEEGKDLLQAYQIKIKLTESMGVTKAKLDDLYEELYLGDLSLADIGRKVRKEYLNEKDEEEDSLDGVDYQSPEFIAGIDS